MLLLPKKRKPLSSNEEHYQKACKIHDSMKSNRCGWTDDSKPIPRSEFNQKYKNMVTQLKTINSDVRLLERNGHILTLTTRPDLLLFGFEEKPSEEETPWSIIGRTDTIPWDSTIPSQYFLRMKEGGSIEIAQRIQEYGIDSTWFYVSANCRPYHLERIEGFYETLNKELVFFYPQNSSSIMKTELKIPLLSSGSVQGFVETLEQSTFFKGNDLLRDVTVLEELLQNPEINHLFEEDISKLTSKVSAYRGELAEETQKNADDITGMFLDYYRAVLNGAYGNVIVESTVSPD